jgi:hypothetical protein
VDGPEFEFRQGQDILDEGVDGPEFEFRQGQDILDDGMDSPEFEFRQGQDIFVFKNFPTGSGGITASYVIGTGVLTRGVRPERDLDP